jgi:hypothetical protein
VVAAVLGTTMGETRSVVGSFVDGDTTAAVAASLTAELTALGAILGLGELGVTSLKAPSAARVFARQAGAVLAIELDPKRPLGELEVRLRTTTWAPDDEALDAPVVSRVPTAPFHERTSAPTRPPYAGSSHPPSRPPPPPPPRAQTKPTAPPPLSIPSQLTTSVGSGPVFSGDLEEFSLPDLLEFLRNSHRTGLLMCTTDVGIGTIQLSRGMIIGAESPNALDLREHFLTSPDLAPERRRALATLPLESFADDVIDGVLVSRELVRRDEVERARIARIYSAFREMINWTAGRFSFDPAVPIAANPSLALSAQSILMHLYQEQDEQNR